MAQRFDLRPLAAAALANTFLGATIVATRSVAVSADPLVLAFLRYAIGALTLLPLLLFVPRTRVHRGDLLPVLGLGIALFGVFPYTYATALHYAPASRGALVFATAPLLTLVIAALLRVEAFTRLKLAGALLALAGVLLTFGRRALAEEGGTLWTGELFMLVTVLIGASYNVLSRRYLLKYSARLLVVYFMGAGALFLAPFAALRIGMTGLPDLTLAGWGAVLFTGTCGGSLGYFLFIWALEKATPTRVAVFVALNPITATALAAWLLKEQLTVWFLLGLGCVVAGILLANHARPSASSPPRT
jgi:drug/metabolite transporter (DMT)-like permease